LSWLKIPFCNLFSFKILWIATMFSHIVFLFYFLIFSKLYLSIFLYWADWEFSFVIFFKTLLIATVFLRMVFFCFCFFYDFLWNYLFFILFFNIEQVKNYSYNSVESTVTFLANYCGLLQCFFSYGFFCFVIFFPKIICQFYFLNIKLVKNCNYK
jgi:hypothetical protein